MSDKRQFNKGRPKKQGPRHDIQKHAFMDEAIAAELALLAEAHGMSESAMIRYLIHRETKLNAKRDIKRSRSG